MTSVSPFRWPSHESLLRRERIQLRWFSLRANDQAGWHASRKLAVPTNISLLPLPPKPSELTLEVQAKGDFVFGVMIAFSGECIRGLI
jgi:hypothetical protein